MNELDASILNRVCFDSSIGAEVVVVDTVMILERSENGICDWVGVIEVDTVLTETAAITVVKKTDAVLILLFSVSVVASGVVDIVELDLFVHLLSKLLKYIRKILKFTFSSSL